MAGVNKVMLLGNLGADPEVKHLESGSVVARISLATSESWKDKQGNKQTVTEWHDVELWDGLAKVVEQYVKKGDSIFIEGKIKSNKWTDEQGNNRKTIRIRATNMTMIGRGQSPSEGGDENGEWAKEHQNNQSTDADEDDLPF